MSKGFIHVAIAEDQLTTRLGIIALLESVGNITIDIQAADGIEMLEKLQLMHSLPDLCIIDINMPQMNGFTLLSQIKELWPTMKCLVFTVHGTSESVEDMIGRGANGYVLKTGDPEDIINAVLDIHETGYHYSAIASRELFDNIRTRAIKVKAFSEKDMQFINLIWKGYSYPAIAGEMNMSLSAVHNFRDRIFQKFNVGYRHDLVRIAVQSGIIDFLPLK